MLYIWQPASFASAGDGQWKSRQFPQPFARPRVPIDGASPIRSFSWVVSSVVCDMKPAATFSSASPGRDKTPLVSVIICAYNPDYLAKAIARVIGSTYANVEIIVSSNLNSGDSIDFG